MPQTPTNPQDDSKRDESLRDKRPFASNKQGIDLYADWFASLPIQEQQELIKNNLAPETKEGDGNYTFEVDPDHQAYATLDPQYEDSIDPTEARTYTEDEVQEVIRRVVLAMQMSESPDCLFQARCILIAFGIGDPPTETELAKQKDCSRQFVSKKVKRIQQMFNLTPSQFMRSQAACDAYSKAWQRVKEKQSSKPHNQPRLARAVSKSNVPHRDSYPQTTSKHKGFSNTPLEHTITIHKDNYKDNRQGGGGPTPLKGISFKPPADEGS